MKSLMSTRAAVILSICLLFAGCKSDDTGFNSYIGGVVAASPPVITGKPATTAIVGSRYAFKPVVSSSDPTTVSFGVRNKPRWLSFDESSGALSGSPQVTDIGTFEDVTITVSVGAAVNELPPFDIQVIEKSGTTAGPSEPPPPPRASGSKFAFSEIPEIVFVRGYPETEHMGIFHLDTLNRWTPGDLENETDWSPRIPTELVTVSGSLSGVRYDAATGVLSYDGSGRGSETATVRLSAPVTNVQSEEFQVRVLEPTLAWGEGANQRFPGIGHDSASTPWIDLQRLLTNDAPYNAPNVLLVTPGTYTGDFYIAGRKRNLYILGEPGHRPVFRGDSINLTNLETAYLKNLELWDTVVDGHAYLTDRRINVYVTKIYQHDSKREVNGFGTPAYEGDSRYGIVTPPGEWRHWIWNFHGSQMGGTGNTTHQFYLEGRPNTYAIFNNVRITGSRGCSAIKSTRFNNFVRNSYISAVQDEQDPTLGLRSSILLDVVSAATNVVYNNTFVGADSTAQGGVGTAMVFFRARRDWWGADSPAYPDVSWSPATTSLVGGGYLAPYGYSAGPETFVSKAFWDSVGAQSATDPDNPYTFKKFLSYNTFRWLDEGENRRAAIRDDGTAPRAATAQFSKTEYWGTVPANWSERSVTFTANNVFIGWAPEDAAVPHRWIDMVSMTPESQVTKTGPGPWAYPAPERPWLNVGGESGPTGDQPAVTLPDWFVK